MVKRLLLSFIFLALLYLFPDQSLAAVNCSLTTYSDKTASCDWNTGRGGQCKPTVPDCASSVCRDDYKCGSCTADYVTCSPNAQNETIVHQTSEGSQCPTTYTWTCGTGKACSTTTVNGCVDICNPRTTCTAGAECGTQSDGCGGTISCGPSTKTGTCSGCNYTTYTCTNNKWVGTNQGGSSNCNYTCTGSWCRTSDNSSCGQTCSAGPNSTCVNNSATCGAPNSCQTPCTPGNGTTVSSCGGNCTGPMCNGTGSSATCQTQCYGCVNPTTCQLRWASGSLAPGQCPNTGTPECSGATPTPAPVNPTPTPPPPSSCTGCFGSGGACTTVTSGCPSTPTDCNACSGGQCNSGFYDDYIYPSNKADGLEGPNGYIVVTRDGTSTVSLRSKNQCDGFVNISNVSSTGFAGGGTKPVVGTCAPLPNNRPYCPVTGNAAPAGTYTTQLNPTRRGSLGSVNLTVYVVSSSQNLSYTCSAGSGNNSTNVVLTWAPFQMSGGRTANRYCAYTDGVESDCINHNNPNRNPSITLAGLANDVYLFQVYGWYTNGTGNQEIAQTIAEATIETNRGTCIIPSYEIRGSVFIDTDGDGVKDSGEQNYRGGINIRDSRNGQVQTGSNGNYTITSTEPGNHTVEYRNPPAGYQMTRPITVPPPSYLVRVGGGSCDVGESGATCDANGNISNLNFGMNINSSPWIQATGGNIRMDGGIDNPIPSNASSSCQAGGSGGPYMALPGNGGEPGIIYSGDNSASFGNGFPSSTNWVVQQPEGQTYSPPTPNTIRTAYGYLEANAGQQGLTINDLAPYCPGGLGNCTLGDLPTGIYKTSGNLTLNASNIRAGRNVIILIGPDIAGTPGNLTIRGNIDVPQGSTAIFSASGDIYVESSVGEATNTSSTPNIEGIFSADRDFVVRGTNNCSVGPDRRLNVEGNIISNAALLGGSFTQQRDLCLGNVCPSVSIVQRLDLIVNLPPLLKAPNYIWKEVAP